MNIEKARFNMIEQQIRPWNVLSQDVLDKLIVVKREDFFPESQKSLAFFDTELPLLAGAHSMSPKLEARIAQELAFQQNETVLLIGAGNGYLAALIASMTKHVTVMEAIPELKSLAEKNLMKNAVMNVDVLLGDGLQIKNSLGFDVIVVNGSLESIPSELQNQLNAGGRLFAIVGKDPIMSAQIITRESELFFNTKTVFETSVKRLPQAQVMSAFKF
ncbi:MAG: protein-L-isoaspartate O-methyltransferase [Burkholderiaceae bacterium]|nr:protein-L-isoaspartate O-methyltransferase [Burkholderiaceae bacterium]